MERNNPQQWTVSVQQATIDPLFRPKGTAATSTIYHAASFSAGDGYFCVAVNTDPKPEGIFEVIGTASAGIALWNAYGAAALLNLRGAGYGSVTLKNAVIAAQPAVKVMYTGRYNGFGQAKLVMNNGGSGNSYFEDSLGRVWAVEDIGTAATGLPQLKYDSGSGEFLANINMGGQNINIWNNAQSADDILISIQDNASAAQAIYINTGAVAAQRLVQGSGGDLTFNHISPFSSQWYSPTGRSYIQVYMNETTLGFEHNNSFIPFDFYIEIPTTNIFVPVLYNSNAATAGKALRWDAGNQRVSATFTGAANLTTKASTTLRPSQVINFS